MNLIGKNKLKEFLNLHPQMETAVSAFLKELDQPEPARGRSPERPSNVFQHPFGKFRLNYHYNPIIDSAYIIYVGLSGKSIPAHVTMPEMDEDEFLIREKITILSGRGKPKEIVERELVKNDLRDEDYAIPKAEAIVASEKIEVESFREIRSEAEYKRAFYRAVMIFDSPAGSEEHTELLHLLALINAYENIHCKFKSISFPEIVKLRLDEIGYSTQMLAEDLRERIEVVENFLEGRSTLPKKAINKLGKRLRIQPF